MTKRKRSIGSEPHIIRAYLDSVNKLQVLHAALAASTVPELSMPKNVRSKVCSNLDIVPFKSVPRKSVPVVPFSGSHMSKPIVDTADQKQNAFETFLAVLHASEFLTWLFGPSIKILRALKSGAPLFMWLFKTYSIPHPYTDHSVLSELGDVYFAAT